LATPRSTVPDCCPVPGGCGNYHGPAGLIVDGESLAEVTISLRGWVDMIADRGSMLGPPISGRTGWDGSIDAGLTDDLVSRLTRPAVVLTLRAPDGRETVAFITNSGGKLAANTDFPFDA
jgi:hypothetical protein